MCPICYALDYEVTYGVPWEPTGEIASLYYEMAIVAAFSFKEFIAQGDKEHENA
jgi:hypothetical protein